MCQCSIRHGARFVFRNVGGEDVERLEICDCERVGESNVSVEAKCIEDQPFDVEETVAK